MRRFILLFATLFSVTAMFGQLEDDCATAIDPANVYDITAGDLPSYSVMNVTLSTTDDGTYQPTQIGAAWENSYYAFTVPAGGFFTISVANGVPAPSGDLSIGLAETDCTPFTTDSDAQELGFGDLSAGGSVSSSCEFLTPGTTYIVAIAVAQGTGGTVTLSITESMAPTNDDCANADPVTSGTPLAGTNNCASSADVCAQDNTTNHVSWFSFTKTATDPAVDLEIVVTDNGSPSDATSVNIALFEDCAGTASGLMPVTGDLCGTALNTTYNFTCVSDDVIFIAVGSEDGEEGDFTITVTESNPSPSNDICSDPDPAVGATNLGTLAECEWETFTLNNTNACPETFDDALCDLDMDAVVWYEFTLPAMATGVEVGGLTPGGYVAIYTACPTAGGNALAPGCIDETTITAAQEFTGLTAGNTYFMAAAITGQAEGAFEVQLKAIVPPANNDCADAVTITAGAALDGTTNCAGPTFSSVTCSLNGADSHDVFYSYTNATLSNIDIDVTITANMATTGVATTDVSLLVYTDACDGTLFNTDSQICSTLGTVANIDCILAGETIILMVGSSDGTEGDFNISITEDTDQPGGNNDVCDMPSDVTPTATCAWEIVGLDNISACPEAFSVTGGCSFADDNTVWYEFTVPSTGTDYTVEFQNISGTAYMAMFNDNTNCISPTPEPGTPCMTGMASFGPFDVMPGQTYYLAVGDPTVDVAHTFEIRINELPENDECDAAIALVAGSNTGFTTSCATQENPITFDSGECTDLDEVNTVWFTYEVPAGDKGFNLTLTATGATGFMGDVNVVVFETTSPVCDFNMTDVEEACTTSGTEVTNFECVGPGNYVIRISTSAANEGDFDINIEALDAIDGDLCDEPNTTAFDPAAECEWVAATATTVGACPETNDFANDCGFDDFPVVWYEVTAPAGATLLDLRLTSATAGTPFIGVYDGSPIDCDNLTEVSDCYDGIFMDLDVIGEDLIDVMGGNTYLIGVGTNEAAGGDIVFEIKFIVPPVNDQCADAEALADGDNTGYTTSCATQEDPISFNSAECTDDDEVNTVWFTYMVPPGDKGFNLTLTATGATGFMGDVNVVVFETTSPVCDFNMTDVEEACTTSGTEVTNFECVGPGDYVIRISTSAANEGDFDINIEALAEEQSNDDCNNAEQINLEPDCVFVPVAGDNTGACPENFDDSSCAFNEDFIVWYEVAVPMEGVGLEFANLSPDLYIGVFADNCDELMLVGEPGGGGAASDCIDDDEQILNLTEGTYLIGVGFANMAIGAFTFDVKTIVPPGNDDPCDVTGGSPYDVTTTGDTDVTISGTNECATQDFTDPACVPDGESSVYYHYEVPAGTNGITVTLASTGTGSGFMLGGYDFADCNGNPPAFDGTVPPLCDAESGDELEFTCLEEGDIITIMVSTLPDNAGTFDLTIDPTVPEPECIANDLCADANDTWDGAMPVTDDPIVCADHCNLQSCPDDWSPTVDCDYANLPTVFFSVTTDANAVDATMTINITGNGTNPIDPVFSIIEACGTPPTALPDALCVTDGSISGVEVMPNTTYIVVVADGNILDDINGGDFNICVAISTSCNDDPCSPYELDDQGGGTFTAEDCDTNIGSTVDVLYENDCGGTELTESSVYFQYTGGANIAFVDITVVSDGSNGTPLPGTTVVTVFEIDPSDCAENLTNLEVGQACGDIATLDDIRITCPEENALYLIQVATAAGDEGDFDITVVETEKNDPCAVNDVCADATVLDVVECEEATISDCNAQSCPEAFIGGACNFEGSPVVWFTFTTPDGAYGGSFEATPGASNGLTNISMAILLEQGCLDLPTAVNADAICVTGPANLENLPLEPNTQYSIIIGTTNTDPLQQEGFFDLTYTIFVAPENDDPCVNSINPPADLNGGGYSGTTCCARGFADDGNADFPFDDGRDQRNVDCNQASDENAVWHTYTPDPDENGWELSVTGSGITGNTAVEVYWGQPNAGCTEGSFMETVTSSCGPLPLTEEVISNCPPNDGDILFIKVASADDNCGGYTVDLVPASCTTADDCENAEVLTTMTQETCEDPLEYIPVEGCILPACAETEFTDCNHADGPTVWFQIDIDNEDATKLVTQVIASGFDAVWSIYEGTGCGDLTPIAEQLVIDGTTETYPCSNSDGDADNIYQTPIDPDAIVNGLSYWIAITAVGEITDPEFILEYNATLGCLACTGEDAIDCGNGTMTAEILEDDEWIFVEDDYQFCQGIDVRVCIEFNYNTTGSGNDWLHGWVPIFGPGWDVMDADLAALSPIGDFVFFEEGAGCDPVLNGYNLPNVCTYEDPVTGKLKLCNTACGIPAECPCSGGMEDGDPLPSGFWYNTPGGSPTCGEDCSPASFYGWPSGTDVDVEICLEIKTKVFDTVDECLENRSLRVGIQAFSDAISGCWVDSNPCIVDPSFGGPNWQIECNVPPAATGEDQEICFGGTTDIPVTTVDGSTLDIIVEVEDNPNVIGETLPSFVIPGGSGSIQETLELVPGVTTPQEVIYTIYTDDPDLPCEGPRNEIIVTVYPELVVEFIPNPDYVCQGECKDISPVLSGGTGVYTDYLWDTGASTPSIEVCPEFLTTYFVTVTDELGCTGVGFVDVDVKDSLQFDLGPDLQICQDGIFDGLNPQFIVIADVIQGSSPISWVYDAEPGLVGTEVFPGAWGINEENSIDLDNNGLELCFLGTDFFGCSSEKCVTIFISGEPEIIIIEEPLECGETEFCFDVIAEDVNFNPIPNLIIRSCDGDLLWDFDGSFTGNFNPPCFDLNEFSCFEITAFDPLSGCEAVTILEKSPTTGIPIVLEGTAVCEGETATVTITNATDYTSFEWTVAGDASGAIVSTTDSYSFVPDSTTTVFVTTEDATGCTASETAVITFNASPVVTLAPEFTFCAGGSSTAEVSGGVSYSWTVGATEVSTTPTYTSSTDGEVVVVTVTDANGCTGTATTTFSEESEITINIIGSNLCDGAETELSFSGDFVNIVWSDGTMDVDSIFVTAGGTYTVTAEDVTGCPAQGTITIEEFVTPSIDVTDLVDVCRDDSGVDSTFINFNNLVSGDAGVWTQIDAVPAPFSFVPPLSNVSFLDVPSGQYQFQYTTNSATMPCMDVSDTLTINVKSCPCPSVDVRDPDPICNDGGSVNLNSAGVKITGEDGTWTVETGPPAQDLAGIISGAVFTADGIAAGDYGVLFTLADSGGPNCQTDSLIKVTVIEGPFAEKIMDGRICSVAGGSDPITVDLNTLINATAGGVWTDSDGNTVTNTTIDGTSITGMLPVTLTYTYTTMLPADSPCNDVSVTVDVVVRDCNCPLVEVGDTTICNSAAPILLDDLLLNPDGLAGTWSSSAAGAVVGNTFDPAGLNNNTFTITYTLDASPGPNCPLEYTGDIQVVRQPALALLSPPPPCSADTGNGATTTNLYDWIDDGGTNGTWVLTSGPNPLVLDDQGGDNVIVDFNSETPGTEYTFTYTANSVNAPCINPEITVTIVVADCECPPIELVQPAAVCNDGGTLDLATLVDGSTGGVVSDPGTFTIVRVGTSNMPTLNGTILDYTGLQAGNYLITYTLDQMVTGSCIQSDSDTLIVSNYRTVTLQETLSVCNNEDNGNVSEINLSALPSNGGIGTWASLDGDIVDLSNPSFLNFAGVIPGDYRFEYTVENEDPCPDFSAIITITVDPCDCPLYNPGPTSPQCITDGNTMIDLTQWDDAAQPGTWSSDDFPVTGGVLDATGATAGDYEIVYTITEVPADPDCPVTDTLILSLQLPATAGTGADIAVCRGDDDIIDLTLQLTDADAGGSWTELGSNSGGLDPLAATFNTTGLMAGTYQLQYGFSAVGECPESFTTLVVTVEDLPIADAGADFELSCDDPTTTIGGTGTSSGSSFSYLWEEVESGLTVADATSATTTVSAPGLYRLTVTNDATGCMSMDEVRITESDDKPSMVLTTTDLTCFGDNDGAVVITEVMGGDGNYEYSINGSPFGPLVPASLINLEPGEYTIEIRDGNGCSTPYIFTINEPAQVTVAITQAPVITGDLGDDFVISLEPIDTAGLTIIWSTTEVGGPEVARNVTSITVSPEENTNYYVEVFDANGCPANANVQLQLQQIVDVTFPSIFNPQDNDGNNTFYINSDDVETVEKLAIYDRWGNLVFLRENFLPNDPTLGWDGEFNGKPASEGVYVFYTELTFVNTDKLATSGDVTIVR